jgi:hypothetical protein
VKNVNYWMNVGTVCFSVLGQAIWADYWAQVPHTQGLPHRQPQTSRKQRFNTSCMAASANYAMCVRDSREDAAVNALLYAKAALGDECV